MKVYPFKMIIARNVVNPYIYQFSAKKRNLKLRIIES